MKSAAAQVRTFDDFLVLQPFGCSHFLKKRTCVGSLTQSGGAIFLPDQSDGDNVSPRLRGLLIDLQRLEAETKVWPRSRHPDTAANH